MRGFEERRIGGASAILRSDLATALTAAGVDDPEAMVERLGERRRYAGRGRPALVDLPRDGAAPLPIVARAYRRGGSLRGLFPTTFFSGDRARIEIEALVAAAEAGVPVAPPVAAVRRRAWGFGYRAWLVTEEVPDCHDLLERLGERGDFDARATIEAVGRAMRRLHEAGISVPDLHVKNVLVPDASPSSPVLIDFDRASIHPRPLPESARLTQIFRFDRSLEKAARRGVRVTLGERARLVRGYLGDTPLERETRRRALEAHRKHLARHRRVWKLTGR